MEIPDLVYPCQSPTSLYTCMSKARFSLD